MDRLGKLALNRLGWSLAGVGTLVVNRAVRRRYGVQRVGRAPLPVAVALVGAGTLVNHYRLEADRAYWYEKGRQDEAAEIQADDVALREAAAEDDGTKDHGFMTGEAFNAVLRDAATRMMHEHSKAQHPSNGAA